MININDFEIHTSYHQATGFRRKGHNEFYCVSRCGRWHTRTGNYGTMILTDRRSGEIHVVKGKMPEVVKKVNELIDIS